MKRLMLICTLLMAVVVMALAQGPRRVYWGFYSETLNAKNDTAKIIIDMPNEYEGNGRLRVRFDTTLCNGVRPEFAIKYQTGQRPGQVAGSGVYDTLFLPVTSVKDSVVWAFGATQDTSITLPQCDRLYLYIIQTDTIGMKNTAGTNTVRADLMVE